MGWIPGLPKDQNKLSYELNVIIRYFQSVLALRQANQQRSKPSSPFVQHTSTAGIKGNRSDVIWDSLTGWMAKEVRASPLTCPGAEAARFCALDAAGSGRKH